MKGGKRIHKYEDEEEQKKKLSRKGNGIDNTFAKKVYGKFDYDKVMRQLDDMIAQTSNVRATPNFQPFYSMSIHAKFEISQPEDESEMQADEMADSFMRGDADHSQHILSQHIPEISPKGEDGEMQTSNEFDQQLQSSKGRGQKLDESTKGELEEHTGTDLSGVNVHTNSQAHEMSQDINAKAFAHGQDIYFKQGNYNPQSEEGKSLLAHEVAHTVQQSKGVERKIQRSPTDDPEWTEREVKSGETFYGIAAEIKKTYNAQMSVADIVKLIQTHDNITALQAGTSIQVPNELYFKNHESSQNANASQLNQPNVNVVQVPSVNDPNADPTNVVEYEDYNYLTLSDANIKSWVELDYSYYNSPWWNKLDNKYYMYLPSEDAISLFDNDPDLRDAVFAVGFNLDPGIVTDSFTKELKIPVRDNIPDSKEVNFTFTFTPSLDDATKAKKPLALQINFVSSFSANKDAETATLPKDYRKSYMMAELDKAQDASGNKIGTINGIDSKDIPENEKETVRYYIRSYFTGGSDPSTFSERNKEVDVMINMPSATQVYYTLYFLPAKDKLVNVTVKRIGDLGKVDPEKIDISMTPDYPNTQDVKVLKDWLGKRYLKDGIDVPGDDVATITQNMNSRIMDGMSDPNWYSDNYNIYIVNDESVAHKRMNTLSDKSNPKAQAAIIPWEEEKLKYIELSLLNMNTNIIAKLKETRMIRQKVSLTNAGVEEAWGGTSWNQSSGKTVLIYDNGFKDSSFPLFYGGSKKVQSANIGTITHEFGHIVAYEPSSKGSTVTNEQKFETFIASKKQKPFTGYAIQYANKPKEFFAESFKIYYADPEFLKSNHKEIYDWFYTLDKTGTPP